MRRYKVLERMCCVEREGVWEQAMNNSTSVRLGAGGIRKWTGYCDAYEPGGGGGR